MTSFYSGRTVLVTGAAGFLGSHLVERLRSLGARVVAIDTVALPTNGSATGREAGALRFVALDITDPLAIRQLVDAERPEVLFHLAAMASPRACARDFPTAFEVNVRGTLNVLRASEAVSHVVFLSSAAVYGAPVALPMDENHPLGGKDPYATTKIMAETLCENYNANYGRRCSIVRNFNAFGPRQPTEYVIPTIIQQALSQGKIEIWNASPVRDLMFVDNTEEAILAIGSQGRSGVYNVGSGRGIRIGDVARIIASNVGEHVSVKDLGKEVTGSPALVADIGRLRSLGWAEKVPFEEGLSRTVDWYRK